MNLGQLIQTLKQLPPDLVLPFGFCNAHSYRGYYEDLAFESINNATVENMLLDAEEALGGVYPGYKGGEYMMTEKTAVWISNYGDTGELLADTNVGKLLLSFGSQPMLLTCACHPTLNDKLDAVGDAVLGMKRTSP